MQTVKEMLHQIQSITFDACKASGEAAALLGEPASSPEAMVKALEQTAANLEQGTVELRSLSPLKQFYRETELLSMMGLLTFHSHSLALF